MLLTPNYIPFDPFFLGGYQFWPENVQVADILRFYFHKKKKLFELIVFFLIFVHNTAESLENTE